MLSVLISPEHRLHNVIVKQDTMNLEIKNVPNVKINVLLVRMLLIVLLAILIENKILLYVLAQIIR